MLSSAWTWRLASGSRFLLSTPADTGLRQLLHTHESTSQGAAMALGRQACGVLSATIQKTGLGLSWHLCRWPDGELQQYQPVEVFACWVVGMVATRWLQWNASILPRALGSHYPLSRCLESSALRLLAAVAALRP